jgi:Kef-type K+ transport system membrane component KefB
VGIIGEKGVMRDQDGTRIFVLGAVMGVLAILGLFVAAGARKGAFYTTGLGLFLFCVLFIFAMIHRYVGR